MASKRKKKAAKKPLSKKALRALFNKRSEASKKGWQTRRARAAPEKLAKIHKAETAKKRQIREKKNSGIYGAADRLRDRARIEELEAEKAALLQQITDRVDTSLFIDVLPPAWLNEGSFTIATSRCRIRHTAESEEIQEAFAEAYDSGGEAGVFNAARRLLKSYQKEHDEFDWWTDDDPLTFHELISLYFSP